MGRLGRIAERGLACCDSYVRRRQRLSTEDERLSLNAIADRDGAALDAVT